MMPLVSTVTNPISMPTLRSMPPERMTTVCPTETMPSTAIAFIRSWMFAALRKRGALAAAVKNGNPERSPDPVVHEEVERIYATRRQGCHGPSFPTASARPTLVTSWLSMAARKGESTLPRGQNPKSSRAN